MNLFSSGKRKALEEKRERQKERKREHVKAEVKFNKEKSETEYKRGESLRD
jgi:hypothetical protein